MNALAILSYLVKILIDMPVHYHVEDDHPFGGGLGGLLWLLIGAIGLFLGYLLVMGSVNLFLLICEWVTQPFTWLYKILRNTSAGTWRDILVLLFVFLLTAGLVCCFIYPGWLNT